MIHQLEYYGYHGVFDEERTLGQRYYIDLILELDLTEAAQNDSVDHTINYATVCRQVKQIVQERKVQLIETLGENIATLLLRTYTSLNAVTVKVTKPNPPLDATLKGVTVELYRTRK